MAKILVVDDSTVILRTVGFTLRKAGHEVATAQHGLEALAMLEDIPVDLIISDINMPYKNGLELLSDVKHNDKTASIPFILLTADGEVSTAERQMAVKTADGILTKPASSSQITDSVNSLLNKWKEVA